MPVTKETIISQALSLDDADRSDVIARLMESLDGPSDANASVAWEREITRRLDDVAAGRAVFSPWSEARARLLGQTHAAD